EVAISDLGPAVIDAPKGVCGRYRGMAVIVDLRSNALSSSYVGTRQVVAKQLAKAGAAAMLFVSDKPDRMVYTSAFGFYPRGPLPILSIASEDAALLRRLLAKGSVRVRINVQNSFTGPSIEQMWLPIFQAKIRAKKC